MFDLTRVNWNRLYYFYLVGQCRNITTAARYANIDQSGMSRHMMSLEKELGAELLLRSRDGIAFTEIGEKVFNNVSKMIELSKITNEEVDSIRNDMTGSLKILTTQTLIKNCVDYLPQFYDKFPDVCVQFDVSRKMSDIDLLDNYDVALLPKFSNNQDIEYIPCRTEKLAIYASTGYLQKHGTPQKPEDLDHHKLIHYSSASSSSIGFVDFHLTIGRKNKNPRTPFLHLGTPDGLVAACQKDMGIIVYLDEKGIPIPENFVKLLSTYHDEVLDFQFMFKKKQKELKKIKEFIDFFQKML